MYALGMGLERRRMGLVESVARKRAIQLSTAMAEARMALRQRRLLVALRPIRMGNVGKSVVLVLVR